MGRLVAFALAAVVTAVVPAWWCGRQGDALFDGDVAAERALAAGAREWLSQDPESMAFGTGSPRFDGEWFLIVHMAAALGFGQTALEHASLRAEHEPLVARSVDRLLGPRGRAHDVDAWHEDPIEALDGPRGHLAFLGYANLALSMHRRLDPASRFGALNDAITDALARRLAGHPTGLLESYPGETYPADNAAAIASIALHDRATGHDHGAAVKTAMAALRRQTERRSGLMFQRVDSTTGEPRDGARASGTAMAAFVLGAASPELARPWWRALARQTDTVLGFGGVDEVPPDAPPSADVDSGPVIFGFSVSASGFAMASARRFGDRARFRSLFASAWLFGLPHEVAGKRRFVAGGPLGDTLLFALTTAGRERGGR
jgi:hypothetical protein